MPEGVSQRPPFAVAAKPPEKPFLTALCAMKLAADFVFSK
jgi:hypothetical protein